MLGAAPGQPRRRQADGCVLHRIGGAPSEPRTIDTPSEWFEVLDEVFDLPLHDVDAAGRDALWTRVRAAHEAWRAAARIPASR